MCLNNRYIYNPYIARKVYVPCGKCEECQQTKAIKRANRIRCNASNGTLPLFVTLTYAPDYLPFVFREDLYRGVKEVPIYRGKSAYYFKNKNSYGIRRKENTSPIGYLNLCDDFYSDSDNVASLKDVPPPNGSPFHDVLGICYYKDVQDFNKRLYINLKRYNYAYKTYSSYQCSEYGEGTQRPHFHLLIFCPSSALETYTDAIVKSWPYASPVRTREFIQVARDCASYVSGYVNKSASFPKILKTPCFRQKHSYSQGFGKLLDCFLLPKILEKVERGDLRYNVPIIRNGEKSLSRVPVPTYVINRYFPKFKGCSRVAPDSLAVVLRCPKQLCFCSYARKDAPLNITYDEMRHVAVALRNAYERCNKEVSMDYDTWCMWYQKVWNARFSAVLKTFYESQARDNVPWFEMYDNVNDAIMHPRIAPTLSGLLPNDVVNPNRFRSRVLRNTQLTDLYHRKLKQRKVVNKAMTLMGMDV